jgi:hypothetical protein
MGLVPELDPMELLSGDFSGFISATEPLRDALRSPSRRGPGDDIADAVSRSVLVRQHDALSEVGRAVADGRAHTVLGLLRPSLEEFISLSYLGTMDRERVDAYLEARHDQEFLRSIRAQRQFFGDKEMVRAGFSKSFLKDCDRRHRDVDKTMVRLAQDFGWPIRTDGERQRSHGPPVELMADRTNRTALYQYLWAASSRSVHFSPYEALRRVIQSEEDGAWSVTSNLLEAHWAVFNMIWSARLFVESVMAARPLLSPGRASLTTDIEEVAPPASAAVALIPPFEAGVAPPLGGGAHPLV